MSDTATKTTPSGPSPRNHNKRFTAILFSVGLILSAAGGITSGVMVYQSNTRDMCEAAMTAWTDSQAVLGKSETDTRTLLDSIATAPHISGYTDDDSGAELIAKVKTLLGDDAADPSSPDKSVTVCSTRDDAADWNQTASVLGTNAQALTAAADALRLDVAAYQLNAALADHQAALDALNGAIQAANDLLTSSDGNVADNATRDALAAAVAAAAEARDGNTGTESCQAYGCVDGLTQALDDAAASLAGPSQAVTDSAQALADQKAAEAAAAAAQANRNTSGGRTTTSTTTGGAPGGGGGGGGGGGNSANCGTKANPCAVCPPGKTCSSNGVVVGDDPGPTDWSQFPGCFHMEGHHFGRDCEAMGYGPGY